MTDIKKNQTGKGQITGKSQARKLRLNKETLKDLKARDEDRVQGGAAMTGNRASCNGIPNC